MAEKIPPSENLFHPSRWFFKGSVLALVGLMTYGSYFAYDAISALSPTLIEVWHTNREAMGSLYTAYSIAAIVSVLFGGILTDRIGTRKASLLFSSLVVCGAVTVACAPDIGMALVGRLIFGAGAESLSVAATTVLARWFRGRALAFSFGLTLSISRLGTLFSFNTESVLANRLGWQAALWIAAGVCLVSLGCNLLYCWMDRVGERVLKLPSAAESDRIVIGDILRFRPSYWFVVMLCVTFYSAIFPFTSLATDFFHEKWGMPLTTDSGGGFLYAVFQDFLNMFSTAPGTTSIVIFASMLFSPFAGTLVDRIGKRTVLMVVGALLLIPCYLVLGFSPATSFSLPPYVPMIFLGIAFVVVPAALWPAVPLIVEKEKVGTAFGLMTMIQNLGLALFSWLNGLLRDATGSYTASMTMFACLGLAGLAFALLLHRSDRRAGGILDLPQAG